MPPSSGTMQAGDPGHKQNGTGLDHSANFS